MKEFSDVGNATIGQSKRLELCRKSKSMKASILALAIIFSLPILAQSGTETTGEYNLEKGLAIQGYDPVAYFGNKALKGDKKFSATHQGATYSFSSEQNRKAFLQNPSKYEPQYGGWCAYAMGATGEKVEIDPKTFKIVDGKLYLFYNAYFNNTLVLWNKDEANLKKKADAQWKKISG